MTDIVKEIKDICQKLILCKSNIKEGLEYMRQLEPYAKKLIPKFVPLRYKRIQNKSIQDLPKAYNHVKMVNYNNLVDFAKDLFGKEDENEFRSTFQAMFQCYQWILDIIDYAAEISPRKARQDKIERENTPPPTPVKPSHPTFSFTSDDQFSVPPATPAQAPRPKPELQIGISSLNILPELSPQIQQQLSEPSSPKPLKNPTFSFTSGGEFSVPPAIPFEQTELPPVPPLPSTPTEFFSETEPHQETPEEQPPPEKDPTIPFVKMYIEQVREDKNLIPPNEPKKIIMYILNTVCVQTFNREQTVEVFVKLGNELSAAYHKFLITQHNGEEVDDPFFGEVNLVPDLKYSLDLDEIWALLDDFLDNKNWESIKTIINHYISFFVQRFMTIPQETIEARRTAAQTWINQVIEDGNAMTENNARTLARYITTKCKEFADSIHLDEFLKLGSIIAPAYHKYLLLKHKGEEFDHPFDYLVDLDPLYYNDNQLSAVDLINNFLDERDFNYLHTLIRDYFESCIDEMCGITELPPLVGGEEEEEEDFSEEEASSEDEPREMEQKEEIEPLWLDDYEPQHERDAAEEEEKAEPPQEEHVYTKEEILNKINEFFDPFHPERIKQVMLKDLKLGPYAENSDDEKKTE